MRYITNLINDYRQKKIKKRVFKELVERYKYQIETNRVLEQWITQRILDGQQGRRQELNRKQAEIKEMEDFLEFLSKIR